MRIPISIFHLKYKLLFAPVLLLALWFAACTGPEKVIPAPKPDPPVVITDPDPDPGQLEKFTVPSEVYVIHITTGGQTIQKDNYIGGVMNIRSGGSSGNVIHSNCNIEIRGRGNSTWGMPKKPYKIKLAEKQRLLGMSKNKHWTLMANYSDKTLLRNTTAFELSRVAGMHWAIRSRPAELYLNDVYQGQYMLTEHVRVDDERINMDVVGTADNNGNAVTGGYLFLVDSRKRSEGVPGFTTPRGLPVVFEDPETLTVAQRAYLENLIKQAESDIYSMNFEQFSEVIDIKSFIQYFFVQELAKNIDGNMRLSTYMWKPRGGKLGFPCVWDFDLAFGNCYYMPDVGATNEPTGWHIRNCIWYNPLFRNQAFVDEVTRAWREFYPKISGVETNIREWAAVMDDAQNRNFQKWTILGYKVWPNLYALGTYQAELDYMLGFLRQRADWMNTEIEAGRLKIS